MTKPCGAECANHSECTPPDLCFDEANDDVQRCVPSDNECKVMPGNGEPCGLHFGAPSYCADHLNCVLDDPAAACRDGVCQADDTLTVFAERCGAP
jgi:hypothetical protein